MKSFRTRTSVFLSLVVIMFSLAIPGFTQAPSNPLLGARTKATIYNGGSSGGFVQVTNAGGVNVWPKSGQTVTLGKVGNYNAIATSGAGVNADLAAVDTVGGAAAVTTAPINSVSLPAGVYEVDPYFQQGTAATTSESLQLTIGWTDDGAAQTQTTATAYTGNAANHVISNSPILVYLAAAGNITYAVAYTSVGGTAATFNLHIRVVAK